MIINHIFKGNNYFSPNKLKKVIKLALFEIGEGILYVILFQLGLKFLIPTAIAMIVAHKKTGGLTWLPIILGFIVGCIAWIVLTSMGL